MSLVLPLKEVLVELGVERVPRESPRPLLPNLPEPRPRPLPRPVLFPPVPVLGGMTDGEVVSPPSATMFLQELASGVRLKSLEVVAKRARRSTGV